MAADYKTLLGLVRELVDAFEPLAGTPEVELVVRARAAIGPSVPKNDPAIIHTHQADACCSKPLMKAARAGELDDKTTWLCPKCDTDWKMAIVQGVHNWIPISSMTVFRP